MAKILDVKGRQVWDSRGRPTVEAEVIVGRGTTPLAMGRAIAPAGASTGSGEAKTIERAQGGAQHPDPHPRRAARAERLRPGEDRRAPDRARRHARQEPARRQRHGRGFARLRACRRRGAKDPPVEEILPGRSASRCPCRRSRSSAAARTPRRAATSRTTWSSASAPAASPRRWTGPRRSTPPPASGSRSAARCRASPTKAATGRRSSRTRKGLAELVGAIADAGLEPGADVAIALDIAASQLYRGGSYHLALEKPRALGRAAARHAAALDRALPDRFDRGPFRRARRRGDARLHQGGRASRSSATTSSSPMQSGSKPPTARATPCC